MELRFVIEGEEQLSRNLRTFATSLDNLKEFYDDAVDIISDRSDRIFASQGSNLEKAPAWRQLSSATLLARKKGWGYYRNAPSKPGILRWTGNLQESRTKESNNRFGQLTFDAPYATYHQNGGGRLPKRAIIDLDNNTNAEIVRALQKKIDDELGIFGTQA